MYIDELEQTDLIISHHSWVEGYLWLGFVVIAAFQSGPTPDWIMYGSSLPVAPVGDTEVLQLETSTRMIVDFEFPVPSCWP